MLENENMHLDITYQGLLMLNQFILRGTHYVIAVMIIIIIIKVFTPLNIRNGTPAISNVQGATRL